MMVAQIRQVHFQITRNCNLRCPFCGQWGKKGFFADSSGREMTYDEWADIVHQLVEYRQKTGKNICVTVWGGEPLVSPDFDRIMELLKSTDFETEVITNGVLLDRHLEVVRRCVDRLYVSLDGPTAIHDAIRGNGVFDRVCENLRTLGHDHVIVMSVITKPLLDTLDEFLDALNRLPVRELFLQEMIGLTKAEIAQYKTWMKEAFTVDAIDIHAWETEEDICFAERVEHLLAQVDSSRYRFDISHKQHGTSSLPHCRSPFYHPHIAWNGNVLYCTDFYDFSAGNVRNMRVEEIFTNEKSERYRAEIMQDRCVTCSHCSWKENTFGE